MALAHAIMTALIEDELSGYELARDFDNSPGFFWQASHQQIYLELRKLAAQKWLNSRAVNQRGKPDKIVYALTPAGRKALAEWVYGTTRTRAAKDELLLKLYNLNGDNAAHLTVEIGARRDEMMRRLYLFEKIRRRHYSDPSSLPARRKGVYLSLLAGIRMGEQFLAWCDDALALIATVDEQGSG